MSETTKNANEFSIILEGLARDSVMAIYPVPAMRDVWAQECPALREPCSRGERRMTTGVEMDCRCELGYVFIVSNAVSTPGLLPPCAGAGCWGHSQK